MNYGKPNPALYKSVEIESKVANASPHELIQMLFDGMLLQLQRAKVCFQNDDNETMQVCIQKAFNILSELQDSLSTEVDSDLPYNLGNLYEYMQRQLVRARTSDSEQLIDEVIALLEPVSSAWRNIGP